jgi:hypothetical protein
MQAWQATFAEMTKDREADESAESVSAREACDMVHNMLTKMVHHFATHPLTVMVSLSLSLSLSRSLSLTRMNATGWTGRRPNIMARLTVFHATVRPVSQFSLSEMRSHSSGVCCTHVSAVDDFHAGIKTLDTMVEEVDAQLNSVEWVQKGK